MEFNQSILTQKGRTLMAKAISGRANIVFTKMQSSSTQYQMTQLEMLTSLSNVKQRADVVAEKNNGVTVKVKGTFDNYNLNSGYDFRTVGLYANDPDEGEILYSVSTASVSGYMPPNTGVSATGIDITFYVEVGNADKVNLEIDPAGFATKAELRALEVAVAYANSADGNVDFTRFKSKENLLSNGDFSKGFNNAKISNESYEQGSIEFVTFDGKACIKLTNINYYNASKYLRLQLNEPINSKHTLSFDIYVTSGNTLYIDGGTSGMLFKKTFNTYHKWQRIGQTFDNNVGNFAFYSSTTTPLSCYLTGFKIEDGEQAISPFISNPKDKYINSFMRYLGLSIKDSTNPNDYKWQVNPEWQRAQSDYEKSIIVQTSATNLVSNGGFDTNTSGWVNQNSVISALNKVLNVDSDNTNESARVYQKLDNLTVGNKLYVGFKVISKNNKLDFRLDFRNTAQNVMQITYHTNVGYSSAIFDIKDTSQLIYFLQGGSFGEPNNSYKIDDVVAYDLTAIFGKGNEPTKDEMDRLLAINVNSPTIYSQSIAQAKLNAHPINSLYYTESAESPETTFGGKWTKLGTESKFSKTFNVWQRTQ